MKKICRDISLILTITIITAFTMMFWFCILVLSSCAGPIPLAGRGTEQRLMTEYLEDKYAKEFEVDRPKVRLGIWPEFHWMQSANARDKSDPPIEFTIGGWRGRYGDEYDSNYSGVIMAKYFKDELEKNGFDFEDVTVDVYFSILEEYSIDYRALTPENILREKQLHHYIVLDFIGAIDIEKAEATLFIIDLLRPYEIESVSLDAVGILEDSTRSGGGIDSKEFKDLTDAQEVFDFLIADMEKWKHVGN